MLWEPFLVDLEWAVAGLPQHLADDLRRVVEGLGQEEPDDGLALTSLHVLRCHYLVADYFAQLGVGLANAGARSPHLLQSAISRQHISFDGERKWTDLLDIAATLFFGLIKNHAFFDANKRTALLSCFFQLQCQRRIPDAPQADFERLAEDVAANDLARYARFTKTARNDDAEVRFIADFLRRHTRRVDKREYHVSYRQLDAILRRYGFRFAEPHDNKIYVCREKYRDAGFLRRRKELTLERITQIGFKDWGTEVSGRDLRHVREETRLSVRFGVDSQVFFQGVDPIESLIAQYAELLKRLSRK